MGRGNNVKSRCFRVELYEDTESYDFLAVRGYIESRYDYVAVRHDKDIFDEDGENHKKGDPKKTHWHYVIRWEKAPRTASGVSKELGVEERFIIPVYGGDNTRTGLKASLLYLTHVDELEKYQYDFSEVIGKGEFETGKMGKLYHLWSIYTKEMCVLSDEELLSLMCDYIKNSRYLTTMEFLLYCCSHGWLACYKKYCQSIHRVIDEHNAHYNYVEYT